MLIIVDLFVILILALLVILGVIGNLGNIFANIFVITSIIILICNIIFFIKNISKTKYSGIVKIKKILLIIFFVISPIFIFIFMIMSGSFEAINYVSFISKPVEVIYIRPEGFIVAAIVGSVINLVLFLINYYSDSLASKNRKTASVLINYIIILTILLFPLIGNNLAMNSRINICKNSETTESIVKEDSEINVVLKLNFKRNTVDLRDPIELTFLNKKVSKGEVLYKTGDYYTKDSIKYLEVFNDSKWGYIPETDIN